VAIDPAVGVRWLPAADPRGNPPGLDPWGAGAVGSLEPGHRGELTVDGLLWLHNRAYDPTTRAFISPDPLPSPAGRPWSANTYNYAANDPAGFADPVGLQALTDQELQAIKDGWTRNAWDRYGGYVIGGMMIAGGVALVATGVGGVAGSMLLGAGVAGGFSAVTQQAFSGDVNWRTFATEAAIGAATGGLGSWTAGGRGALALTQAFSRSHIATQLGTSAVSDALGGVAHRGLTGGDPFDPRAIAIDALVGVGIGHVGSLATRTPLRAAGRQHWPPVNLVSTGHPGLGELDQFAPGAALAGAYHPATRSIVAVPSGSTRLVDGTSPANLERRNGAHGYAMDHLASVPGYVTGHALGFTVFPRRYSRNLSMGWLSRSVNDENASFEGVVVPPTMRPGVVNAVESVTGRRVVRHRD
jgi:RHS repeat-associated protein